jgi:hypothetical protein
MSAAEYIAKGDRIGQMMTATARRHIANHNWARVTILTGRLVKLYTHLDRVVSMDAGN